MSKKRTSPESSTDEEMNEGSDSVFQEDDNANKRAKLISLSDTTLQDLPMKLIECILVKAVAMEVKDMKLAKSVWKAKADLVITRLSTVCPQWWNILMTNFFRNELHRTLDCTAQKSIRLEILHQSPLRFYISKITTMKDEIFMLCFLQNGDFAINVYDRNNVAEVKDVIPLPGIRPDCMAACSVSNCLYILYRKGCDYVRISRIARNDENQFNITPLITDVWMPNLWLTLSVAANGSIISFVRRPEDKLPAISIYNADGSVQRQMRMHSAIPSISDIIPKPNGNLVLVSCSSEEDTILTEIDMDATIIRQHQSSSIYRAHAKASHAGIYGRMLISDYRNNFELLDSEFNLLEFSGPQLNAGKFIYDSERNEVVTIVNDEAYQHGLLTIFHFTEE